MAKIKTVEKHGSVGSSTFQRSRHGMIERQRVGGVDPKTSRQLEQRALLGAVSSQWRGLTDEQRAGWKALAGRLAGQLSGSNVYNQVNAVLVQCGLPGRPAAPAMPVFGRLTCAGLVVDNTPRVQLLQVNAPAGAERLMVQACGPVHPGLESVENRFRHLAALAVPAGAPADLDLTAVYLARFPAPKVGQRVFVRLVLMQNGFKGEPLPLSARVAGPSA